MMRYKYSQFNQCFKRNDETYLYNAMTGALAQITDNSLRSILKLKENQIINSGEIPDKLLVNLQKCGFVVQESVDEYQTYIEYRKNAVGNDKTLRIVVAPTLGCNFKCPYCYEEHVPSRMAKDIQQKLIEYINKRLEIENFSRLVVCWYGGEPLLAIDIIESLARKLMAICHQKGIIYQSIMVSNGYLLDEKNANILKNIDVKDIQITIDGTKTIHGKRRILKGKPELNTYEQILAGINIALEKGIQVSVRMNIDSTNMEGVKLAIQQLSNYISDKQNVHIYLGKLFSISEGADAYKSKILSSKEFIKCSLEGLDICKKLGFKVEKRDIFLRQKPWYCPAPYGNSIVIDPWGYLYYCWNDIGRHEYSIGILESNGEVSRSEVQKIEHNKWKNYGSTINTKCRICKALPLCGGGCARQQVHGVKEPECDSKAMCVQNFLNKMMEWREKDGNRD